MSNMTYQRVPLSATLFVYACHFEGANYVQVGLGYESANGLQVTHVTTDNIHHIYVNDTAEHIEKNGCSLKTGRLLDFFGEDMLALDAGTSVKLAAIMRKVHDDVWGGEYDWEPRFADFSDGRFVWLAYDSAIDKIRLGLGYRDGAERVFGDHSFAVGRNFTAEFIRTLWIGPKPLIFFARPARWPQQFSHILGTFEKRGVAVSLLELADTVWPGGVQATA